jgi:hypothetical protein
MAQYTETSPSGFPAPFVAAIRATAFYLGPPMLQKGAVRWFGPVRVVTAAIASKLACIASAMLARSGVYQRAMTAA